LYTRALTDSVGNADQRAIIVGAMKGAVTTKNFSERAIDVSLPSAISIGCQPAKTFIRRSHGANDEVGDTKTAIDFCEWLLEHFHRVNW